MMELFRQGGSIEKDNDRYSVCIDYSPKGDIDPALGLTQATFHINIPLEVGDGMTVDELYTEAFRRVDLAKDLL